MKLDAATVLSEYDAQVRRGLHSDGSGAVGERAGPVVRWRMAGGEGWSGVVWSDLDSGTADAVIADQVRFFADRGVGICRPRLCGAGPGSCAASIRAGGTHGLGMHAHGATICGSRARWCC